MRTIATMRRTSFYQWKNVLLLFIISLLAIHYFNKWNACPNNVVIVSMQNKQPELAIADTPDSQSRDQLYKEALAGAADSQKFVIIAMVDLSWIDMAINFYQVSLKPFNIESYLFVSLSTEACEPLLQMRLRCFVYINLSIGNKETLYMSNGFLKKMFYRTEFIYKAVTYGYHVISSDLDNTFLGNPLPDLASQTYDIAMLRDKVGLMCACFVAYRGKQAEAILLEVKDILELNPRAEDQGIINKITKRKKKEGKLNFLELNPDKYLSGLRYYEEKHRYFIDTAKPCKECLVVQNNWIVSKDAKVYRSKEMHQWFYDGDSYYSNPAGKYLLYDNHVTVDSKNDAFPKDAFKLYDKNQLTNALAFGEILNRSVILPRFHCPVKPHLRCPLNTFIYINRFDKQFRGNYRESTFLLNPLVPDSIKNHSSPLIRLSSAGDDLPPSVGDYIVTPKQSDKGLDKEEILAHFATGSMKSYAVLKFSSMKSTFAGFTDEHEKSKFESKIRLGFVHAVYRQYNA